MKTRITPRAGQASGKRKGWVKLINSCEPSKAYSYAFDGDFLDDGVEVEVEIGATILNVDPRGSVKNWWKEVTVSRVTANGEVEVILGNADWHKDFLKIRDAVMDSLGQRVNPLAAYSDDEIMAEYTRRGL